MSARRWRWAAVGAVALVAVLAAAVLALNRLDEAPLDAPPPSPALVEPLERWRAAPGRER